MNIFDFGTGGDCFLIEINGLFGLAKTIAQKCKTPRGTVDGTLIWRVYLFENCMRLEQISFGRRAISLLIEKLSQFLKTGRQRKVGAAKGALGDFQRCFGHANRLGQPVCSAQRIEFVVEDGPKLFFTFHYSSPTLAYLGNQPGGEVLSRKRQSLTLITSHVAAHKEGGRSDHIVRRHQLFAVPSS